MSLDQSAEAFWTWFQQHEETLFGMDDENPDPIFDLLEGPLNEVHSDLTCEISAIEDGKREFIISANGFRAAFPAVEKLAAAAPNLPRWTIRKYRPRTWPLPVLQVKGATIDPDQVGVAFIRQEEKRGVCLFIPGITEREQLLQAGFLLLDMTLGEFDVATKIGCVEFLPSTECPHVPKFPLAELPRRFDEGYAGRN